MKKLMIAAATAAMVGGAFADAQVWEMSLTAKTTESKIGTVKSACDACDGATSYRKQASVKIAGLFWGCTCDEMVNLTGPVSENEGVFFWNASKKAAFYDQDAGAYAEIDFAWNLLNRIGQKAADCEGVWTLNVGNFALYGAGFGKVAGCDDAAYIKSMNGNFAGTYIAGNGCKRCEEASGSAWALCDCGEATELTAAYGTWTLKYNASVTKKFADSSDWSWYKFPGDTLEAILSLIDGPGPVPGPTPAELAKQNYEKAKQALADAQATVDDITKNLPADKYVAGDCNTSEAATVKGKELLEAWKAADAVRNTAKTGTAALLTEAGKAMADITGGMTVAAQQKLAKDVVDADIALAKAEADYAKDPSAKNKAALKTAQDDKASKDKAYTDGTKDLGAITKETIEAYKVAYQNDQKAAQDINDADTAFKTWKTGAANEEGSAAKAKADAENDVATGKTALLIAQNACIAAGVICE